MRLHGLPPVVDSRTETLILGSFPSAKALAAQQYYGNPVNHFWRLMSAVLGENLVGMGYEDRLAILLKHRIGLWDVFESCERKGSMDAAICNEEVNDFSRLPQVKRVFFNGKKAWSQAHHFKRHWNAQTAVLPSSSPANIMLFDEKLKRWKRAIAPGRG
jgi:hypoxanthine-DNA glycosylase